MKIYKLSIMIISILILLLGIFIVYFGFLAIFSGLSVPTGLFSMFIFGLKFAYGLGLFFEFIFLIVGFFFVWKFYKKGLGEIGAMGSFTATALLHIFTLSYAYAVIVYYETGNILHPAKFVQDLVIWSGAGLFYIILLATEIALLGAAYTKLKVQRKQ